MRPNLARAWPTMASTCSLSDTSEKRASDSRPMASISAATLFRPSQPCCRSSARMASRLCRHVGYYDVGPLGGEARGDGAADAVAPARAGHYGDFTVQVIHIRPSGVTVSLPPSASSQLERMKKLKATSAMTGPDGRLKW